MPHYTDDDERDAEEEGTYYTDEELDMLKAEADQMKEDAYMQGDYAEDEARYYSELEELEDGWEDDMELDGDDLG
jgi:hypothetical protein